jgi:hypothetical protein
VGINLYPKVSTLTRNILLCMFIAVCFGVLPDIDHLPDFHRGLLHNPVILLLVGMVGMGVACGSRLFKSRILKEG